MAVEHGNIFFISAPDAEQNPTGFLHHSSTLFTHIELVVNQVTQVPFHTDAAQLDRSQPVLGFWIIFSEVQDPILVLVELHKVFVSPFLQSIQVSLQVLNYSLTQLQHKISSRYS